MKLSAEEKAERDDLNYDSRETWYLYDYKEKAIVDEIEMGYLDANRRNQLVWMNKRKWFNSSALRLIYPQALEEWEESK